MGKKKDKKKGMDMEAKLVAANRMALAAFEAADALQRRALESGSGVEEATDALRCALEALGAVQAADSRPRDEELVRSAFKRAKAVLKRTEALKAAADAQPSEPLSVAEPASAAARVAESACVAARVAESAEAGPARAVEPASMAARAAEPAPEFAPTPVQAAAPIPAPMPAFEPEPAPASTPVQAAAPVPAARAPEFEPASTLGDVSRETSVRDVRTAPGFVPAPAPGPSGMPAASPDEPLPAPGTLPLSAKERKRQARADARAAKERAAKERTSARKAPGAQAVCDHEAEEAQAKAARKAVVPRAEVGGKAAERPGAPTVPAPVASPALSADPAPREAAGRPASPAAPAPVASPAPAAAACAPEQKQPRAARNACIALLVLLLLVAGLVAAAWLGLFRLPAPVQDRIDLLPDPHAVSGRLNAADSPVAPGSYRLVVNQIPTSQGPVNVVNVEFENPAQNEYSARMDVYLDDTGELVGSTRMVAPGSYLEDLALAADLAPGTYRATAKVGVYSGATQVNTMSAALELRIEGWD